MLSRMGAAVELHIGQPHKVFPVKVFKLLKDESQAQEMSAEPDCMKDGYTKALQARFGSLDNPEVQSILRMHALQQATDIGGIETRHASVRRQVVLLSVQIWRRELSEVSCDWLLQNLRRGRLTQFVSKRPTRKVAGARTPSQPPLATLVSGSPSSRTSGRASGQAAGGLLMSQEASGTIV